MRIGWLADPPEDVVGGAELASAALRAAAPAGYRVAPCLPDAIVPADAYVVMNCTRYGASVLQQLAEAPVIKVVSDWWEWGDPHLRAWLLESSALVVLRSPIHRANFPWPIAAPVQLLPSPLDLAAFRKHALPAEQRNGRAVWLGQMTSGWKGEQQAARWATAQQIHIDFYGAGPFVPDESEYVHLRGQIQYADVPDVLGSYTWFVFLPQRPGSFGRTVVEAWAAGCRLVANTNPGALWWIENRPADLDHGALLFWQALDRTLGGDRATA
jgi:hypothetical protein